MPNHKSPKKTLKKDAERRARNKFYKSTAFTYTKKALAQDTKEGLVNSFREAQKKIMTCYSKGILKKNNAARKISRLNKKVNDLINQLEK